jgi:hypothetical protein
MTFHKLIRDKAGTGAMELSLALPILMLLLVGMVDVSRLVAARIDAEQAAQRTTDYALAIRPSDDKSAYIKAEAVKASGLDAQDVSVDVFLECNGERMNSFKSSCPAGQDRARFVNVAIDRKVEFLFDWSSFSALFGTNVMGSSITVRGDSTVRFQ